MIRPQLPDVTNAWKSRKINMLQGLADIIRPYGCIPGIVNKPCSTEQLQKEEE